MPAWLVLEHEKAIPSIEARELIGITRAVALGAGKLKKKTQNDLWNEWIKLATGGSGTLKPGFRVTAAKFGIAIIEEK